MRNKMLKHNGNKLVDIVETPVDFNNKKRLNGANKRNGRKSGYKISPEESLREKLYYLIECAEKGEKVGEQILDTFKKVKYKGYDWETDCRIKAHDAMIKGGLYN